MRVSPQEKQEALKQLREWLKPGDTVYTVLRHVSRSGMQSVIDLRIIRNGEPLAIGWTAAKVLGDRFDARRQGIVVGECGMDMGFHLVYHLSYALWPKGHGCTGEKCPSNDHSNGDRSYIQHGPTDENGNGEDRDPGPGEAADGLVRHWHRDGGYALRHEWI